MTYQEKAALSPALAETSKATIHELSWWAPLVLFLGGWITYLFRNSNTAFEIGTVIGTIVVFRGIYLLVFKCQDVRFSWVTGCGLLLGYAFGTLNTAAQLYKKNETIAQHVFRLQEELSIALSLVLWASAVLFLAGGLLEKPIRLNFSKLMRSDIVYWFLSLSIYVGALATHQIGYMGATVSDEGHITFAGSIAGLIGPTLPAITVVLRKKSKLLSNALLFWGLLLVEMAMLVPLGRRILIYSLLVVLFAFTLAGDRWNAPLWKKAAVLGIALTGLYCGNVVFYAMRHEAEISGAGNKMGARDLELGEMVTRALKFISEGRDSSFDQEMAENLQDRTFVLKYFSDLITQSKTHTPVHGKVLLFSLSMSTPSAIYSLFGNKDKVIQQGMEEVVANPDFGMLPVDDANSLLTGGISDFGIPGAFIYPVALALFINFLIRVVLARAPELIRVLFVMMYIWTLFQTELSITGVLVSVRNALLLLLFWVPTSMAARYVFHSFTPRALQAPGRRANADVMLVRYDAIPRTR